MLMLYSSTSNIWKKKLWEKAPYKGGEYANCRGNELWNLVELDKLWIYVDFAKHKFLGNANHLGNLFIIIFGFFFLGLPSFLDFSSFE